MQRVFENSEKSKNGRETLLLDRLLQTDYKTLIDAFIEHKNAMSEEEIRKMIGEKVTFD